MKLKGSRGGEEGFARLHGLRAGFHNQYVCESFEWGR